MQKLIFVLLAFMAVFTFIRAFDIAEASVNSASAEASVETPVEIVH